MSHGDDAKPLGAKKLREDGWRLETESRKTNPAAARSGSLSDCSHVATASHRWVWAGSWWIVSQGWIPEYTSELTCDERDQQKLNAEVFQMSASKLTILALLLFCAIWVPAQS